MPLVTAQPRQLLLDTPLGPDVLTLVGFSGREAISELFSFQLDLVASRDRAIPFEQIVGAPATVKVGGDRFFNGIVSRLGQGDTDARVTHYQAELVPQLWLLTRRQRSRIFQQLTVVEVVEQVLADTGIGATFHLHASYQPRDYCVQYRETDFSFASRLLEEEGIYSFFEHGAGGHVLVVGDGPQPEPSVGTFRFDSRNPLRTEPQEVFEWEKTQELRSGKVTVRDHEFELPQAPIEASATIQETAQAGQVTHLLRLAGNEGLELYDYPGGFAKRFDGIGPGGGERPQDLQKILPAAQQVAALRMQEEAGHSLLIAGRSTCRSFLSGHAFTLAGHLDGDGEYLLTSVEHTASQPANAVGAGGYRYANSFTAVPAGVPFRPPRATPTPVVEGLQTAIVVGPAGEHVFTDRYGRVKVQFHWDREGSRDETSSCWLRVAQPAGGAQSGFFWIPEVDDEVLVGFLEGDPDQPVVIGRLFNAADAPPRPDNQ